MHSTTAKAVIVKLREMWARFGIPKQLVSDNGPPFSSDEFNQFLTNNGVEHLFSAPYHPASNGLAENSVKILKRVIKKALGQRVDVDTALQRFLLMYRTTEHSTTKESPAQILQGRCLRTRLDRLKPPREDLVAAAQRRQQQAAGGAWRSFHVGDSVWVRIYHTQGKWLSGSIVEIMGNTDYKVQLLDGTVVHRHVDQIRLKGKISTSKTDSTGLVAGTCARDQGILRAPALNPAACLGLGSGPEMSAGGDGNEPSAAPIHSEGQAPGAGFTRGSSQDQIGSHTSTTPLISEPPPTVKESHNQIRSRRPPERYGFT